MRWEYLIAPMIAAILAPLYLKWLDKPQRRDWISRAIHGTAFYCGRAWRKLTR